MSESEFSSAPIAVLKGAPVAYLVRYPYRHLITAMAEEMRECYGAVPHIFVERPDHVAFFKQTLGESTEVEVAPNTEVDWSQFRALDKTSRAALISRARELERDCAETVSQIAMSDRIWGAGFALGGFYGPKLPEYNDAPYEALVQGTLACIDGWRATIEQRGIKLALVFMGPSVAKHLAVACRLDGVPYRVLSSSRRGNHHSWFCNEYYESNILEKRFRWLVAQSKKIQDSTVAENTGYTESAIAWRFYTSRLGRPLQIASDLTRAAIKQLRHRLSPVGIPQASTLVALAAALRPHIAFLQQKRTTAGFELSELDSKPYVFLPLQLEPEPALSQLSPEAFDQLGFIASVARDLPAGVLLIVKEHLSALGRRPRDYYRQIECVKNVVLAPPTLPGSVLVGGCLAVATLNSTAGMEAAQMGKPVVTWGQHNMYNFLPHVRVLPAGGSMREALTDIVERGAGPNAVRTGRLYVQAIEDVSFDLGSYNVLDHFDVTPQQRRDMVAILTWTLRPDSMA